MASASHLPPEALDEWLAVAASELDLDPAAIDVKTLLDVARDVAHGVARPAAPLTTFLIGLALGRAETSTAETQTGAEQTRAELTALARTVTELAERWSDSH